jgi:hypothetical protein
MQVDLVHLSDKTKNYLKKGDYEFIPTEGGTDYVLHPAEKMALQMYTEGEYDAYNGLLKSEPNRMYRSGESALVRNMLNGNFSDGIGNILLHAACAMTGINRLPDTGFDYVFRTTTSTPEKRQERIASLKDPDKYCQELGFLSTSKTGANGRSSEDVILFFNPLGKDVTLLSSFAFEKEFLVYPIPMKCLAHKEVNSTHYWILTPANLASLQLTEKQKRKGVSDEMWKDLTQLIDEGLGRHAKGNKMHSIFKKLHDKMNKLNLKDLDVDDKYYAIINYIDKKIKKNLKNEEIHNLRKICETNEEIRFSVIDVEERNKRKLVRSGHTLEKRQKFIKRTVGKEKEEDIGKDKDQDYNQQRVANIGYGMEKKEPFNWHKVDKKAESDVKHETDLKSDKGSNKPKP